MHVGKHVWVTFSAIAAVVGRSFGFRKSTALPKAIEIYGAELNNCGGEKGKLSHKNPPWGSMDIFWSHTLYYHLVKRAAQFIVQSRTEYCNAS